MPRYLSDTRPEAEAFLIAQLQRRPAWYKVQMAQQVNTRIRDFALAGVRAQSTPAGLDSYRLAEQLLGRDQAAQLFAAYAEQMGIPLQVDLAMVNDPGQATLAVVEVLEQLQIDYVIGGSVAASLHGIPRGTLDTDIVADLQPHHVPELLARLQPHFYLAPEAVAEALAYQTSFNLIHFATLFKIDIFVPGARPFDRAQLANGQRLPVFPPPAPPVMVASAEDTVLAKLAWYRLGGETSEQQWRDILGILRYQAQTIDVDYLRVMAHDLAVSDLLDEALDEAGLTSGPTPS